MKIPVNLIDSNPYQTREEYDKDVAASITLSVLGRHGILQAPMVRPKKDRFETVFGHGRIMAAKAAGFKEVECRVEDVSDAEMKRYMGQENVLRSDLSESERMAWLEQIRIDKGLEIGETGFYAKMSQETGISNDMIERHYLVKEVKNRLKNKTSSEPNYTLIIRTRGLDAEDQDKLIIKALNKGWSSDTAFKVKTAIKDLDPKVRLKILNKETNLTKDTIIALSEIDNPETQLEIIKYIQTRRWNEETALQVIDDVKKGIPPILNIKVTNEFEQVYNKFTATYKIMDTWSFSHYQIIKDHWDKIEPILDMMETKIKEFKAYHNG